MANNKRPCLKVEDKDQHLRLSPDLHICAMAQECIALHTNMHTHTKYPYPILIIDFKKAMYSGEEWEYK